MGTDLVNPSVLASPTPPRPRVSLLDLPDEVIFLAFQQVYRSQSTSPFAVVPLQMINFLINKRLFEITRSIWSRRLTIQESQLDSRLAGIHMDAKRPSYIRFLIVPLTNHLYNLLSSVFLRLPLLTHLALHIPEHASIGSFTTIAGGLVNLVSLKYLSLHSPRQLAPLSGFLYRYLAHKPVIIPLVSFSIGGVPCVSQAIEGGFRADVYQWSPDLSADFFRFDWSSIRSLDLRGWSGCLPFADIVLEGLKLAITGNAVRSLRILLFDNF